MKKRRTALLALTLVAPLLSAPPASAATTPTLNYGGYVRGHGWQPLVTGPTSAGTTGQALPLEGFKVSSPSVTVQAHVQGIGWGRAAASPTSVGSPGQARRLEALRVTSSTPGWRLMCQAHVSSIGWLPAVSDGQVCGTTGKSLGLEAVRLWYAASEAPKPATDSVTYSFPQPAKARPTDSSVNVRSGPGTTYAVIGTAKSDYDIELTGRTSGTWSQVRWRTGLGWMSTSLLKVRRPAGPVVTITVPRSARVDPASKAGQVVAAVKSRLGKDYLWGGTGPQAYDCSGLTQAAFKAAGVTVPRISGDQARLGSPVAFGEWKPGDLLAWGAPVHHVGIYVGDGMMISAKGGAWGVVQESVAEHNAYSPDYAGARRIV